MLYSGRLLVFQLRKTISVIVGGVINAGCCAEDHARRKSVRFQYKPSSWDCGILDLELWSWEWRQGSAFILGNAIVVQECSCVPARLAQKRLSCS